MPFRLYKAMFAVIALHDPFFPVLRLALPDQFSYQLSQDGFPYEIAYDRPIQVSSLKPLIRLVDKLVGKYYLISMKTIDVGAFEAKTHLSQLLNEVERGAVVKISRRGKPVAVLKQDETISRKKALNAIKQIRTLCGKKVTLDEITQLRDEGRER